MSKLALVKSENFGSATCDFYGGAGNEIWMTREQIGEVGKEEDKNEKGLVCEGGETVNGKVVYLHGQDKPMRSVLMPQPRKRWRWNWRKGFAVTIGLALGWIVMMLAFFEATGGVGNGN